ncbi:putative porin [Pseudomonas duriflava]|uniref:Putative porin n=1 Tax=Pseudomonas duriflava TaxID=459528 RepID=A0A562QKZ3_9PSED|nr:putative porin [Pseudomonas duriflava]TWI57394.1 putative porin [Pseudomonas duriflava]
MRLVSTRTAAAVCGSLLLALSIPANAAVDAKLLDMLRANGSITPAQHAELKAELARETQATQAASSNSQAVTKADLTAFEQKLAWAAKTQIKGDVRLRYENVDADTNASEQSRERVRARIGFYSEINPQVDAGVRIATGSSSDRRSTNQSLENYFSKKSMWVDLAYLDWHPTAVKDLHLVGGKMLQPWVSMGDVIWDGDINPEGFAATYKMPLGSTGAEVFGSAGYYILDDNVDGDGVEFRHDLSMYAGQLGTRFALTDGLKLTLGGSVYAFDGDNSENAQAALAVNGNTTTQFRLYEGFGQLDVTTLPVPLAAYGQYVVNDDSATDQDTAWLVGLKSKVGKFGLDYNYRDVQRDAVIGAFTDSDFANGYTGSRGHKFKVAYQIDKNFGLGLTYFLAESDTAASSRTDADVNTLQVDLEAKF